MVCVLIHQQRQPNRLYVLLSQGVKERLVLEIAITDARIPPLQNDFKLEVKFVVIKPADGAPTVGRGKTF